MSSASDVAAKTMKAANLNQRTVMRAHCPECKSARIDAIMVPRQIGEESAEWRHLCIDCEHYCEGSGRGDGLLWINVTITGEGHYE